MQLGKPSLSLLGCQSLKDGCQREREALHDGEGLVKQSHLQQERDDLLCTHKRIWGGRKPAVTVHGFTIAIVIIMQN